MWRILRVVNVDRPSHGRLENGTHFWTVIVKEIVAEPVFLETWLWQRGEGGASVLRNLNLLSNLKQYSCGNPIFWSMKIHIIHSFSYFLWQFLILFICTKISDRIKMWIFVDILIMFIGLAICVLLTSEKAHIWTWEQKMECLQRNTLFNRLNCSNGVYLVAGLYPPGDYPLPENTAPRKIPLRGKYPPPSGKNPPAENKAFQIW
jgi:hypothetical protein